MKYPIRSPKLYLPFLAITLIAVGFLLAQSIKPSLNPVPLEVSQKITFTPLVIPSNTTVISTGDYKAGPVDAVTGRPLSFRVTLNHKNIDVTETSLPPQFSEIPDYVQRFIDTFIVSSNTVSTASGTIYFGAPQKLTARKQVGLMTDHGILTIFSLQDDELTMDEWRKIGDALTIVK